MEITDIQQKQIDRIEKSLKKLADEKGWDTHLMPINGKEVQITHTMINKMGYHRTKTITVNPDIDVSRLARLLKMDPDPSAFPPKRS